MNSEKDKLANIMPQGYEGWRKEMEKLIERSKLTAVMNVNAEMLSLYWKIGHDIHHGETGHARLGCESHQAIGGRFAPKISG